MAPRVLISTFGFDETKVLRALRWLPYDRLVLVAGGKSLRKPGLRRLRAAERMGGSPVELVRVDPFDFESCFRGTLVAIERHRKVGDDVRVNVSGGTKVLADAALLAAFQAGVEAWHCEDRPLRLPVIQGVRFADDLTPVRRAVLAAAARSIPAMRLVDRLRARGFAEGPIQSAIGWLREQGFVGVEIRGGAAVVTRDPETAWFAKSLR
jgi:hypothetical protein